MIKLVTQKIKEKLKHNIILLCLTIIYALRLCTTILSVEWKYNIYTGVILRISFHLCLQ